MYYKKIMVNLLLLFIVKVINCNKSWEEEDNTVVQGVIAMINHTARFYKENYVFLTEQFILDSTPELLFDFSEVLNDANNIFGKVVRKMVAKKRILGFDSGKWYWSVVGGLLTRSGSLM